MQSPPLIPSPFALPRLSTSCQLYHCLWSQRHYSSICPMNAKEGFLVRLCTSCLPFSQYSSPPYTRPRWCPLVASANEIIRQLLNSLCAIPGNHSIFVVGDKDSLGGLDNNDAFSALLWLSEYECNQNAKEAEQNQPFWHTDFGPPPL